jgi:hypothetical protein
MSCRALNSRSFPVLRNPNNASHSTAFWTLNVVAYVDHVLVFPFYRSRRFSFPLSFLITNELEMDALHLHLFNKLLSEGRMLFAMLL